MSNSGAKEGLGRDFFRGELRESKIRMRNQCLIFVPEEEKGEKSLRKKGVALAGE